MSHKESGTISIATIVQDRLYDQLGEYSVFHARMSTKDAGPQIGGDSVKVVDVLYRRAEDDDDDFRRRVDDLLLKLDLESN